jgi:hypothetical protein
MLRSIRSTAFLGTFLLAGLAVAQTKAPAAKAPASDDNLIESSKPGNSPAAIPVPVAGTEEAAAPVPVAIPAPPPPEEQAGMETPKAQKKRTLSSAGLDSQSLTFAGNSEAVESTTSDKDWGFKFKGYFRGPMRVGITQAGVASVDPTSSTRGLAKDSNGRYIYTPNKLQFHAIPVTPDSNYTRWDFTGVSPGPWAELFFQYGNQRVMMTTSIASYNITSGGWRELQDQLGIDRAFLTLKFPEALGNLGGMAWDVGVFSNFYGAMGKYDGGVYQTYLFGRTRLAGATGTADLELSDDIKLVIEGGFGAKMDQMYQMYGGNNIGPDAIAANQPRYDYPSWQPYPGQNTQNGTNLMAHVHVGVVIDSIWTITFHYLNSFVQDARWNVGSTGGASNNMPAYINAPGSGSIQVMGADGRLAGGWVDAYAGVSYIKAHNSGVISDSIEVLHSQGGWQLGQNYFQDLRPDKVNTIDDGNGNVLTAAGQATFSLAGFMMRPRPFWGQGTDVNVTLFGMFNKITGTTPSSDGVNYALHSKLKYGVDAIYSFMPMMAVAFRGDVVNPNMSDSTQSFYILSPRLIFRSEFVTHEMITLQYSRYIYGGAYSDQNRVEEVMPWPFGKNGTYNIKQLGGHPDENVVTLSACMWW